LTAGVFWTQANKHRGQSTRLLNNARTMA